MPSVESVEITNGLAVVPAALVCQFNPPLVEYLYVVIADPPSEPAVNATLNSWFPGVILVIVGALGVVLGVAAVLAVAVPSPTALTARI